MREKIDRASFNNLREHFEECNKPYIITSSQSRITLKCSWGEFTCSADAPIPANELHFIKAIQAHIKRNKITEIVKNKFKNGYERIKYYRFSTKTKEQNFKDCYEVDIASAYWNAALKLEIITQELYDKGMTMKKVTRLAALGGTARKTVLREFDGKKMKPAIKNRSEETEYLWFLISDLIGKTMYEAYKIAGESFLFFWIDGIYVKDKKTAAKVEKHFKSCKFTSVTKVIKSIDFKERYVLVTDYNYRLNKKTGEKIYTRKFSLPNKNK